METVKLEVLKSFRFAGEQVNPGDLIEATPGVARTLLAIRRVKSAGEDTRDMEAESGEASRKGKYKRKDITAGND